jgi:hypothetical protein
MHWQNLMLIAMTPQARLRASGHVYTRADIACLIGVTRGAVDWARVFRMWVVGYRCVAVRAGQHSVDARLSSYLVHVDVVPGTVLHAHRSMARKTSRRRRRGRGNGQE